MLKACWGGQLTAHAIVLLSGIVFGWLMAFASVNNKDPLIPIVQRKDAHETDHETYSETDTTTSQWDDKSTGWSLVHVFYGTTNHLPYISNAPTNSFKCNTWFSQARQDELIFNLLSGKRNGYFVDIAANDAVKLSNTYSLETHFDWGGICIEANPSYWPALTYRKCHVVGAVVANDREEVHFTFTRGVYGGIVGDRFDNKQNPKKTAPKEPRLTVTLLETLKRFDAPKVIDYMSLDVEGAEDLVLQSSVLEDYEFHLMTIERPSEKLKSLLATKGYKVLKKLTGFGETLFVKRSFESDLNKTALEIDTWNFKENELKSCKGK